MSSCMRCNNCAEECSELCPQCLAVDAAHEAEIEAAIAKERANMRSWLGQQAAKANKAGDKIGGAAFKAAADHLKPKRVKAGLAAKRAARKAVGK